MPVPMFDKAALRMSQEVQTMRFAGTPVDPSRFDPRRWSRADLIDALRNSAQNLLPAAPTRQSVGTIRSAARQAARRYGLDFTLEVKRLHDDTEAKRSMRRAKRMLRRMETA